MWAGYTWIATIPQVCRQVIGAWHDVGGVHLDSHNTSSVQADCQVWSVACFDVQTKLFEAILFTSTPTTQDVPTDSGLVWCMTRYSDWGMGLGYGYGIWVWAPL